MMTPSYGISFWRDDVCIFWFMRETLTSPCKWSLHPYCSTIWQTTSRGIRVSKLELVIRDATASHQFRTSWAECIAQSSRSHLKYWDLMHYFFHVSQATSYSNFAIIIHTVTWQKNNIISFALYTHNNNKKYITHDFFFLWFSFRIKVACIKTLFKQET